MQRSFWSLKEPLLRARAANPLVGSDRHGLLLLALCVAIYLASGVSQPLLMSQVKHAGLGDTRCQLYMLPYYLGQASTGIFIPGTHKASWRSYPLHRCVAIALMGPLGQMLNYAGNMLAGSAIFAVVYSSVTIWCAVLSRFLLQRVLTLRQWACVVVVVAGLALTGIGAKSDGPRVVTGACMIVVGSIIHASTHVLSEFVSVKGERVPPQLNCCIQGITASTMMVTWQLAYTLPRWGQVADAAQEAGTSWTYAVGLLACIALGNFLHAAAFFQMLADIGAVSAGICKAVQAVAVFSLSHALFCGRDPSQCLSLVKLVALVVVVSGVLGYVYTTASSRVAGTAE